MTGKDLLMGLNFINGNLVEEAENCVFSGLEKRGQPAKSSLTLKKGLLIAAAVAVTLLLVGCAVVYALKMQDLKIGETTQTRDYRLVDGTYVKDPHEISQNVLTLAGIKGTAAYQACADYYAFQEEYAPDLEDMIEQDALPEGFFDNYNKAMEEKAAELTEQYGLNPLGERLNFRTTRNMCDALGIERLLDDSGRISAVIDGGSCYESGNFWLYVKLNFPEDQGYEVPSVFGVLRWNRTDCFSTDYVTIVESGDWTERNYTTASGREVLILQSPSQERGYIICDRGEALMSLQLDMNPEILSEENGITTAEYLHMTDKQIELVADMIDFGVQPSVATQEDVDNQPGATTAGTHNGYTLTLKSVETDGYVARILVGVTAPEGTDIESLDIGTGRSIDQFAPASGQAWGSDGFDDVPDGDGLANTKDLLMVANPSMEDGSMPFAVGAEWKLHIVDLWVNKYRQGERLLVEGEWFIPVTFDAADGDYREVELIQEPVATKAAGGWYEDGTDAEEDVEITSFKLRRFGATIEHNGESYFDFTVMNGKSMYAVMKDGSQVSFIGGSSLEADTPIDLDQVDYIQLVDGTKLTVPEGAAQ